MAQRQATTGTWTPQGRNEFRLSLQRRSAQLRAIRETARSHAAPSSSPPGDTRSV
jgi:hypothetical protein